MSSHVRVTSFKGLPGEVCGYSKVFHCAQRLRVNGPATRVGVPMLFSHYARQNVSLLYFTALNGNYSGRTTHRQRAIHGISFVDYRYRSDVRRALLTKREIAMSYIFTWKINFYYLKKNKMCNPSSKYNFILELQSVITL